MAWKKILLSDAEAAYIAGFIDGEGSIILSRHWIKNSNSFYYNLRIQIPNTNLEVLRWIKRKVGYGSIQPLRQYRYAGQFNTQKQRFQFTLYRKAGCGLLEAILPYLIVKKQVALLALEFAQKTEKKGNQIRSGQFLMGSRPFTPEERAIREDYYNKMKALNA
jgi:hypothetical protein